MRNSKKLFKNRLFLDPYYTTFINICNKYPIEDDEQPVFLVSV